MRERQARCVNASPGQYARGVHMTMNDDLICDRCKSSLDASPHRGSRRATKRDQGESATPPGDPSSAVASVVGRGGTGALAVSPTGDSPSTPRAAP